MTKPKTTKRPLRTLDDHQLRHVAGGWFCAGWYVPPPPPPPGGGGPSLANGISEAMH